MIQVTTKDEFAEKVLKAEGKVLVDFWAPWCGPCMMLSPTLEALNEELEDGQTIVKVNVDEATEIAGEYAIMSIPAIKIFENGEIINEAVGVKSKEDLKALLS